MNFMKNVLILLICTCAITPLFSQQQHNETIAFLKYPQNDISLNNQHKNDIEEFLKNDYFFWNSKDTSLYFIIYIIHNEIEPDSISLLRATDLTRYLKDYFPLFKRNSILIIDNPKCVYTRRDFTNYRIEEGCVLGLIYTINKGSNPSICK